MRYWYLFFFILISSKLPAQDITSTQSFLITGRVKAPVKISGTDLLTVTSVNIGNLVITNHMGEERGTAKSLKGVLLKDILQKIEIDAENPKVLSEYYFVCKASDGYAVVFSWNEIFNTATGDNVYIITEKEGKSWNNLPESLLMISTKDFKTGRRHVKSLATIEVSRVNNEH
jgi:hypothetical protein